MLITLRYMILIHVGDVCSHGNDGVDMYWDPRVLFLGRDKRCHWIGKQSAVEDCCSVGRRGRERESGSVSLTYGAAVLTADD